MPGPGSLRLAAELTRSRPPQGQGAAGCWMEPGVVAAVNANAAADGNALVTVTYRGVSTEAAYLASYAPTVGHTVILLVQSSGSVLILGRVIGTPN